MKFSAVFAAASAGLVSAQVANGTVANATVTQVGVVTANQTVQVTITSCKDDACHHATAVPTSAVLVPIPVTNGTASNGTHAGNHTKPEPSQAEASHSGPILANGATAFGVSGAAAAIAAAALLL
ncbi:hypothetical protein CJU89_5416 [Yarrowia sp. B02]|nr:hypothetical protein CJU89_5416 [Yarrowia sp. B02]